VCNGKSSLCNGRSQPSCLPRLRLLKTHGIQRSMNFLIFRQCFGWNVQFKSSPSSFWRRNVLGRVLWLWSVFPCLWEQQEVLRRWLSCKRFRKKKIVVVGWVRVFDYFADSLQVFVLFLNLFKTKCYGVVNDGHYWVSGESVNVLHTCAWTVFYGGVSVYPGFVLQVVIAKAGFEVRFLFRDSIAFSSSGPIRNSALFLVRSVKGFEIRA